MSEDAELRRKVKKAAQLLLLQRHRTPGVRGWELKRSLGREYVAVVSLLREELDRYGLDVKIISEDGSTIDPNSESDCDRARFFLTIKEPLTATESVSGGWRIDDLACLAASLAYIIAHHGKAARAELEKLIKEKFPQWRAEQNLDRFIRRGYLNEEGNSIILGWRSRAEVDERTLMSLILAGRSSLKNSAGNAAS